MPHLIIERARKNLLLFPCRWARPSPAFVKPRDAIFAYFVEWFDILGGVIFTVGSVCFLPEYSHNLPVFLWGCALFVLGSLVYLIICSFTFAEACHVSGLYSFEACENVLYLLGAWTFLVGTILYWPEEAHYRHVDWLQELSLSAYFNFFSPEFEGTILFIVGSVFFCLAAFVNGLNQRTFDTYANRLLTATTSIYMAGSILFIIGSVAFLPDLGCSHAMESIGAWCFIIGSLFYVIGSVVSLVRTDHELSNPENEQLDKADDVKADPCV